MQPVSSRILALCVLALSAVFALETAQADSAWVSTSARGIALANATAVGAMPADMPLHIVVGVRLRNPAQLADFIQSVRTPGNPAYGHYLTGDQFNAAYAPTAAQAQAVADYLKSKGFKNVDIKPNRLLVSATGTVAMVQTAFNTSLGIFTQNGNTYYLNSTDAQVPSSLGGIVTGVLGLNNFKVNSFIGPPGIPNTIVTGGYAPQAFWKAYGADAAPTGGGISIAVFTATDVGAQMIVSLHRFDNQFGLPPVWSKTTVVPALDPGQSLGASSGLGEWDLDAQSSTGMAGDVSQLFIYEAATSAIVDATIAFNRFVTDNVAKAGSASFGFCDGVGNLLVGWNVMTDPVFAQGVAQGQTVFASSGDVGPACPIPVVGAFLNGVPNGGVPLQQTYPASSPYVVAVGGTTLALNPDGSYDFETAWDAGGGGPSTFEPAPSWQNGVVPTSAVANRDPGGVISLINDLASIVPNFLLGGASTITVVGKGLPDIAMDADFVVSPGAYFTGCTSVTATNCGASNGGTSLASPLALGAWARVQGAARASTGKCYGFAAPLFYALAPGQMMPASGFTDVTLGTNGGYPATAGWDYATGLGSINVASLIAALPAPTQSCGGGGGGGGNNSPVAVLTASPTTGAPTLTVQFDGTGSSDPDAGDSVAQYIFHFGDGTPDVPQTTGLASHAYTAPGTFNATLTVKDTHQASSAPVSVSIVVNVPHDPNLAACAVPGIGLLSDAAFDNLAPTPGTDLASLTVAEPYAASAADVRLVFTLNTDAGRAIQPLGSGWYVSFPNARDNTVRGVRMLFRGTAPAFESYTASGAANSGGTDGRFALPGTLIPADPASNYDQKNGRITIVVKPADLNLQPGDLINGFNAASTLTSDPLDIGIGFTLTIDQMPDSLAYENAFVVYGNSFCPPAASPVARLSATALNFGDQGVNVKSAAKNVVFTNTGAGALSITAISTQSSGSVQEFQQTNDCPGSLAVGASCAIAVTFKPLQAGARTGGLSILSNNGRRSDAVSLSGNGITLAPAISLSTRALDFGGRKVNTQGSAQPVTLTNSGTAALTVASINAQSASSPNEYHQTNDCASVLAAGAHCTISVTFKPLLSGAQPGTMTITTNAPSSPDTVTLSGSGTP